MRLDVYLKENYGYSREYAKSVIEKGLVAVNGVSKGVKPALNVSDADKIVTACGAEMKYVGRGGYKLEKAVERFGIKLTGCVCIDVGSSTGGFTDCMLQNGAEKIYAVDVGTNQLAEKLRNNTKVVSMEKTNINEAEIKEKADFISVDVSFVSLSAVVDRVYNLLNENGSAVMLVKPQFEAGRSNIGKKGIVKDRKVHRMVIKNVCEFVKNEGFCIKGIVGSPIKGGDGNIEYLIYVVKNSDNSIEINAENVVNEVFGMMGKGKTND